MQLLFDAPDFSIAYDDARCWLYVTWMGAHPGMSSQARCELILDKVQQTHCSKILNDSARELDCWGEVVQWLTNDFFRQLAQAGVVAVAWVLPHNLRARADTNQVVNGLSHLKVALPVVDTFTDVEAAYTWLQKNELHEAQSVHSLASRLAKLRP